MQTKISKTKNQCMRQIKGNVIFEIEENVSSNHPLRFPQMMCESELLNEKCIFVKRKKRKRDRDVDVRGRHHYHHYQGKKKLQNKRIERGSSSAAGAESPAGPVQPTRIFIQAEVGKI